VGAGVPAGGDGGGAEQARKAMKRLANMVVLR
jgi:hypothetical protein